MALDDTSGQATTESQTSDGGLPPDLSASIAAARTAGYDDAAIYGAISASPKWAGRISAAASAGHPPHVIGSYLGLTLPAPSAELDKPGNRKPITADSDESGTAALAGVGNNDEYGSPRQVKEPPDLSGQYNTALSPEKETEFQAWAAKQKAKTGRDPLKDAFDYDIRGAWASGATAAANGHLPDTFKKPNHPTFSNESQYNGAGGQLGGAWGKGRDGSLAFQPSSTNIEMHGEDGLSDYFASAEPDAKLLPAPLPTAYVGEGKPYQSGWNWQVANPGQPMHFVPNGEIQVPGQTTAGAAGTAAVAGAYQGFSQLAAAVPRWQSNLQDPFDWHDLSPEDRAKAQAWYDQRQQKLANVANTITAATADTTRRNMPVDPKYAHDIAVNLAGGIGGMAPMVLGAMLGGVPGGALVAGTQAYETTTENALAHGATPQEAHSAGMIGGMASGLLMTVPAAQWLGGLAPSIQQPVINAALGLALHSGSMVGIMEAQTLTDNIIARATFAPGTQVTAGLGEHITDHALLGALLPFATHTAPHLAGRLFEPLPPTASTRFQDNVLRTQDAAFPAFDAVDQDQRAALSPVVTGPLADAITAQMRYAGLPPNVGVRLVNQIAGGAADSSYARGVITMAMDTPPEQVPFKVHHETIHALLDPELGLLNDQDRQTLFRAANNWLNVIDPGESVARRRLIAETYGVGPLSDIVQEEGVARMSEAALLNGITPRSPVGAATAKITNFVTSLGQGLRGQGFRTADDVFNGLMRGDRAEPVTATASAAGRPVAPPRPARPARPAQPVEPPPAPPEAAREEEAGTQPPVPVPVAPDVAQILPAEDPADIERELISGLPPLPTKIAAAPELHTAAEPHVLAAPEPAQAEQAQAAVASPAPAVASATPAPQQPMTPEAPTSIAPPQKPSAPIRKRPVTPYSPEVKEPERLINFLRRPTVLQAGTIHEHRIPGGLQDTGGNVRAILGGSNMRPGLLNQHGRTLEDAAQAAWEAGYFPEFGPPGLPVDGPTIKHLLDAIREDHAGNPRYSEHDQAAVEAYRNALAQNDEIDRLASEYGIPLQGLTQAQFFDRVADHMSLDDALRDHNAAFRDFAGSSHTDGVDPEAYPPRSMQELEDEHRQADAAEAEGHRGTSDEGPALVGQNEGAGESGEGQGGRGAGDTGRPGPESSPPAAAEPPPRGVEAPPAAPATKLPPKATGTDLLGRPITETTKRGPEPTVKNDPNQVTMPGMEPSAVQAQAAADQKGRGAIGPTGEVKPANEGLFAPDTSGQGVLPTPPAASNETPRPAGYGANNKVFTADAAAAARERLRAKLNRLNAGFDPEMMLDGLTLAGYHIEAGARSFADYTTAMLGDLGDAARPFLRGWYENARYYPGHDASGMSSHAEIEGYLRAEADNEQKTKRPDGGVGKPGSGETGKGGRLDGLAEGDKADRPLADIPPGNGAPLDGVGAEHAEEAGVRPGTESLPGTGGLHPGGDADTGRTGGSHEGLANDGTGNGNGREPTPAPSRPNFHVDDPETLIGGTPKVRFARNRAALEALAAIEAEQRAPSHEELQAMAGYIGWGSFGQDLFQGTFDRPRDRQGWNTEAAWLREHLGKEQWESAQRSIINAHYTDPPTVKAMWDMVRSMGFKGGRVLEPSMGIGNFYGLMPRDLMGASSLTGIELDSVTGRMAKLLYPDAGIHIKGYQDSHTPDNFYDLVIGNWPFDAKGPADRRYDRMAPTLHDYFFLKALDQTRPGGLVVGITSAGTMDKAGRATRLELARKGELLASFRLPSGAFEKYAGTSVVTDIIVLRKRAAPAENPSLEPWISSAAMDTPAGVGMSAKEKALRAIRVNQYYHDNPNAVLGQLDFGHGTTSGQPGMIVHRPDDLMQRLERLPSLVPSDGYDPNIRGNEPRFLANNTTDRNGSIIVRPDGKLYQVVGDQMLDMTDTHPRLLAGSVKERQARINQMRGMVDLRRGYGALIDAERDGNPETEELRQTLAKQFSAFRKDYGSIKDSAALKLMQRADDPGYALVRALERPDGTPSRILSESTVRSKRSLENPSITDAYILARNEQTILDVDRVAELAKLPREAVIQHLVDTGAMLRTPGGGYEPTDQHLSGNVRKKLAEAQQALAQGEPMQHTVDQLTAAIPETVPYFAIEAKLGAPWVGDAAYKAFIGELLGLPPGNTKDIDVQFLGNRWKVTLYPRLNDKPEADLWGHNRFRFDKFISKAMGNETLRVMDPEDRDGGPYFNAQASEEANAKAQALREKFTDWAWADPERKVAFEQSYNQTMNAIAKPKFDGSFMDMSGMALRRGEDPFSLRRHQVNAIWRGVIQGRGLFAHEVGTGKAQPLDAKVLTPSGWKRMGEITLGDVVIAGDGSPTLVEAVFPQGDKPIFRVTFSDGATTECCDEHLWLTQTYRERNQAINGRRAGKVWPCAQAKVRPLSEIRDTLVSPHLGAKNHSIPMVGAVQFNAAPLPLDPYVMGVLLGDGGFTGRAVTFSSADEEVVSEMRRLLPQDCEVLHRSNYDYGIRWNGAIQYAVGGFGAVRSHPVIKALEVAGAWGLRSHEKFIPAAYLVNSTEARIALLQGLMDTDGTADRRGCGVSYCTTSLHLADDVTALVQSLGGVVTRTLKHPTFKQAGTVAFGRLAYTLNVSLPATVPPFRLARKAALVVPKTKYPPRRFITAIEPVGIKPAQCIRVAHPSHLYVTDDFIVTHNTYTMGGIAVEGRRYGVFRKPLLFAHNANSATVAREINEMYPGARVHYVDNLSPGNIATEMHRIANEDWDLIVMPHSLIDRMSLKRETLMELAAEDIANLENEAIEAAGSDGYNLTPEMMDAPKSKEYKAVRSPTAKELVKARQAILTKIEKDSNRSSRADALSFEDLGVDAIMVDEAHVFKKPPYVATRMRVKGLNTATSNRSIGLGFLTSYVKRANSGRNVYLFTGTPITNSLNEIFNQSRYFMDDRLEQAGVKQWDAWFNTFAAAQPDVELTAGGQFENVTRLASFVNTDELVRMMSEFTDVVQAKDMPEFVDRTTKNGKTLKSPDLTADERDFLTNGRTPNPPGRPYKKIITDVGEMSPAQREVLDDVRARIAEFKAMDGKGRYEAMMTGDRRSPIITDQDGPKASLDVRNYNPDAPDDEGSKVNRAVRNMLRIYQEPGAAQMVFMETGYNAGVSQAGREQKFILVRDMVNKLVLGGIPRNEIAVVAGGVTPEQKKDIADKMNDGRLRVAIGQTETLGTGVNAQRQLRAIHHMDAPWRPGDLEQRNGRGERQGNEWNTMLEYRYITEGIDGRRWQVLTSKDGFIKKFINAFNNPSGKRLGAMEVDADALAENEDITQTLSAAAGDPRIMLRAKYKGDVNRLERRERLHTIGQADALEQVRRLITEQRRNQADAQDYTSWGDTWRDASQRAADHAMAAGDTRRWYEVQGTPQEAEAALRARAAEARTQLAQVNELIRAAQAGPEPGKEADTPQQAANRVRRIADLAKKAAEFTAQAERADAATKAAQEGNNIWHEGGDAIQARIDAQVAKLERAPSGTTTADVPTHTLATINGFDIEARWPPGNPDPLYSIVDPIGGRQIAAIAAPTMGRIIPRMNVLHENANGLRFIADRAAESIKTLQKSAMMDFPQREVMQNKKKQLAKIEADLQDNPTPPPGWLRHGAPMDSTIYVDGKPREVRGHHIGDDYYLGTDEGDVPYLNAKDENGQRIFDVHPAPPDARTRAMAAFQADISAGGGKSADYAGNVWRLHQFGTLGWGVEQTTVDGKTIEHYAGSDSEDAPAGAIVIRQPSATNHAWSKDQAIERAVQLADAVRPFGGKRQVATGEPTRGFGIQQFRGEPMLQAGFPGDQVRGDRGIQFSLRRRIATAFDGVKPEAIRKQMGLTGSSRDEMGPLRKTLDDVQWLLSPTSRGPAAKKMGQVIARRTSMQARGSNQAIHALENFATSIERLPRDQQLAITHRVETGQPQPTAELQAAMSTLKRIQEQRLRMLQSIGKLKDVLNSDDYMGRIYSNYREWKAGEEAKSQTEAERIAVARGVGKSPVQGSGAFLKQRTFATLEEAMAAGLIPVTFNPIKMQILKIREMDRFYHGTRMADEIKEAGLAHWVPSNAEAEAAARSLGWEQLGDKVFQPRIPGGSVGAFGRVEPGNYWAPKEAALVFNNYVSRGMAGNSIIYDALRSSNTALNGAQLGLSGFHATFVTLDSAISSMALGLQQVSRGVTGRDLGQKSRMTSIGQGLQNMAEGFIFPIAAARTVREGSVVKRAWLDPQGATPEYVKITDMLNAGGGRISMDQFYRSNASGTFFKNLHDLQNPDGAFRDAWQMMKDTPLTSPFKIVGRMVDTLNEPLMGQLVPRMKSGVFSMMAKDFMERHPDATPEQVSDAMTKNWDSVENRLGQMTYDNVFWHKTLKDSAFLMTRSVGWNLGTIRELAGAGVDSAQAVRDMASGKAPELTNRMAYTMAMPLLTAMLGGMVTYLLTGKAPESMLDYFYPRSGTGDPKDPDRLSIPGYIKDVVAYYEAPVHTVINKTSPLPNALADLYHNRDYYGRIIYAPQTGESRTTAYAQYMLNQALPFSVRSFMKNDRAGAGMLGQSLGFFGIQPAPQSVTHPKKGEAWQARQDKIGILKRARAQDLIRLTP